MTITEAVGKTVMTIETFSDDRRKRIGDCGVSILGVAESFGEDGLLALMLCGGKVIEEMELIERLESLKP